MRKITTYATIISLALPFPTAYAWNYNKFEDSFDETTFHLVVQSGTTIPKQELYKLRVGCSSNKTSVELWYDGHMRGPVIKVKFDKEKPEKVRGTTREYDYWDIFKFPKSTTQKIVQKLKKHRSLTIRASVHKNRTEDFGFNLAGFSAAMAKMPPQCQS